MKIRFRGLAKTKFYAILKIVYCQQCGSAYFFAFSDVGG